MWEHNQQLRWRDSNGGQNGRAESRYQMERSNAVPQVASSRSFEPNDGILPALLRFFGLKQQPFGVTPDPSFLYLSRTHREALASLVYGIEAERGFLALVAKPGMGKTTLLFHLLDKFRSSASTAFIFQTQCTSREFLQLLSSDLGLTSGLGKDLIEVHEELNSHLMREARAGKRFIVIVDEAQNLDPSVLETIRLLSNFETPHSKLMQIVLSGQPQLRTKLASRGMVQLHQRISLLNRLEPLSPLDTENYIQHRLRVAGYKRGAFLTSDAMSLVTEFSNGIPRKINNACFNSMSLAFALQRTTIDAAIAHEAISDLERSLLEEPDEGEPEKIDEEIAEVPASREVSSLIQSPPVRGNGHLDHAIHAAEPTQAEIKVTCHPTSSRDISQVIRTVQMDGTGEQGFSPQVSQSNPAEEEVISDSTASLNASTANSAKESDQKQAKGKESAFESRPTQEASTHPPAALSFQERFETVGNTEIVPLAEAKAYMNHFIRNLRNARS